MPSFFKTVVISALVACPTVFVNASAADKKDENKKDTKKDKKSDSSIEGLDTVIAKRYPKLDKALIEKLRALYQAHVHRTAAFSHFMVTDELTGGGAGVAVNLKEFFNGKSEVDNLVAAYKAIAEADSNMILDHDTFFQAAAEGAAEKEVAAKIINDHDKVSRVAELKEDLKATFVEAFKTNFNLTDGEEVTKFDKGVKSKLVRLVTAIRSLIESSAECALGLCDKKAIEAMEKEDKAEKDKAEKKAKEEAEKAQKGSSDKAEKKEDDKPTADKALKKFEDVVVKAEKEAKKLFAATRIGSLEKKIKDQKDSNRSLALGLGLGLGLGLPFVFGVGIFAAMKAGCLQYNPVA